MTPDELIDLDLMDAHSRLNLRNAQRHRQETGIPIFADCLIVARGDRQIIFGGNDECPAIYLTDLEGYALVPIEDYERFLPMVQRIHKAHKRRGF